MNYKLKEKVSLIIPANKELGTKDFLISMETTFLTEKEKVSGEDKLSMHCLIKHIQEDLKNTDKLFTNVKRSIDRDNYVIVFQYSNKKNPEDIRNDIIVYGDRFNKIADNILKDEKPTTSEYVTIDSDNKNSSFFRRAIQKFINILGEL